MLNLGRLGCPIFLGLLGGSADLDDFSREVAAGLASCFRCFSSSSFSLVMFLL